MCIVYYNSFKESVYTSVSHLTEYHAPVVIQYIEGIEKV
jgi:hypothetical protein